jgi:hypothetical protein
VAAARASAAGWRLSARVHVPGTVASMLSVTAVSAGDAWAVGATAPRHGRPGRLLFEHWSGRRWRPVAVPARILAAFAATARTRQRFAVIAGSAAGNIWAFNQLTGAWLRRDGRRWSEGLIRTHPGRYGTAITAAVVLGRSEVWAFGTLFTRDAATTLPFAARFDGRRWRVTAMPRPAGVPGLVSAASAVSPGDIWATLGYGAQEDFPASGNGGALAHWNGRAWRLVPLPKPLADQGDPTSIAAVSRRDVWVGGGAKNSKPGGLSPLAARWDGRRWQVTRLPSPATANQCVLASILPVGLASLQALDLCFINPYPGSRSQLWRLSADHWSGPVRPHLTSGSSLIFDLALAGRTSSIWAVGFAGRDGIIALHGPVPR